MSPYFIGETSYLATCETSFYVGCVALRNTEALRAICISSDFPCVLNHVGFQLDAAKFG